MTKRRWFVTLAGGIILGVCWAVVCEYLDALLEVAWHGR